MAGNQDLRRLRNGEWGEVEDEEIEEFQQHGGLCQMLHTRSRPTDQAAKSP